MRTLRNLLLPLPPMSDVCTSMNCPPGVKGCTPVLVARSETQIHLDLPAEIQSPGCVLKPDFFSSMLSEVIACGWWGEILWFWQTFAFNAPLKSNNITHDFATKVISYTTSYITLGGLVVPKSWIADPLNCNTQKSFVAAVQMLAGVETRATSLSGMFRLDSITTDSLSRSQINSRERQNFQLEKICLPLILHLLFSFLG